MEPDGDTRREEDFRRVLQSRTVQERLVHLAFYEGAPPERALELGIDLSDFAHRVRRGAA